MPPKKKMKRSHSEAKKSSSSNNNNNKKVKKSSTDVTDKRPQLHRCPTERTNGVFPADILFTISTYLSLRDIVKCQTVCRWWRSVFAEDVVWRSPFLRDFGVPPSLDEKEEFSWYSEYLSVMRCMRLTFEREAEEEEEEDKKDEDEEAEEAEKDEDEEVEDEVEGSKKKQTEKAKASTVGKLVHWGVPEEEDDVDEDSKDPHWTTDNGLDSVTFPSVLWKLDVEDRMLRSYSLHKLAIILLVFSENNNKIDLMNDSVVIGYRDHKKPPPESEGDDSDDDDDDDDSGSSSSESDEETSTKKKTKKKARKAKKKKESKKIKEKGKESYGLDTEVIPLSKFCYAILTGREKTLFPRMRANDPGLRNNFEQEVDVESWEEDDFHRDERRNPTKWSVGVSPKVGGEFSPFIHYLMMNGRQCKGKHSERYVWETTENGWLPVFLNASFSWFCWADIVTETVPSLKAIRVNTTFYKTTVW
eukprot:TRINITY_DN960_c0_g1_i1.p1 TRINITY_DN960_c0_g1~~TRINITY_DN960_c0_g1_i1.p1  ORF type:complete len:473 (+),score=149.24 TRINITY_DN960_c0_g1_i1:140-1558(+)